MAFAGSKNRCRPLWACSIGLGAAHLESPSRRTASCFLFNTSISLLSKRTGFEYHHISFVFPSVEAFSGTITRGCIKVMACLPLPRLQKPSSTRIIAPAIWTFRAYGYAIYYSRSTGGTTTDSMLGPDQITIFHPAAFEAMDGTNNKNTRSDWYDIIQPGISPIFSRDESSHIERRRVWTKALSTKGGCIPFSSWTKC